MRAADGSLHYTINGEDQGVAIDGVPPGVHAVIDLYGVCGQASVVHTAVPRVLANTENSLASSQVMESSQVSIQLGPEAVSHRFSLACGSNVEIGGSALTATRRKTPSHCLAFSAHTLEPEETFEVKLDTVDVLYSGSLMLGLTALSLGDEESNKVPEEIAGLADAWWVDGSRVLRGGQVIRENYGPGMERLSAGDRVGVRRGGDGAMRISVNGEDLGVACLGLPPSVRAVFSLSGQSTGLSVTSSSRGLASPQESQTSNLQDSLDNIMEKEAGCSEAHNEVVNLLFHENRGRNVALANGNTVARRNDSYNQGIVVSARPLATNSVFQVTISHLSPRWSSSLALGVTGLSPDKLHLPVTLLGLKRESWVIAGDGVFHNGTKMRGGYGPNLESLQVGHSVGVLVDPQHRLHLYVNGVDQGVACKDVPPRAHAVFDMYGMCDELVISGPGSESNLAREAAPSSQLEKETKSDKDRSNCMSSSSLKLELPHNISNNCEYLKLCTKFKLSLGLPNVFFEPVPPICFCETCHKLRGEESVQSHGNPRKKFALPIGWVKFLLRKPVKETTEESSLWHLAYHGTSPGWIRRMLDCGKLLTGAEVTQFFEKYKSLLILSGWSWPETRAPGEDEGGRHGVAAPLLLPHRQLRRAASVCSGAKVHRQDNRNRSHG